MVKPDQCIFFFFSTPNSNFFFFFISKRIYIKKGRAGRGRHICRCPFFFHAQCCLNAGRTVTQGLLMQRCSKTGLMRDCSSKRSVLDQSGLSVRERSVPDLFCASCVQLQVANTLMSFHIITFSPQHTPHCAPPLFVSHARAQTP